MQVEQIDREAAASGYFAWCSGNPVIPDRMKTGTADDHGMVQAFARHRIAERERVVGEIERWLWETDDDITGILCRMNDRSELTAMLQAVLGGRDAA